jgi:hypothetical protein
MNVMQAISLELKGLGFDHVSPHKDQDYIIFPMPGGAIISIRLINDDEIFVVPRPPGIGNSSTVTLSNPNSMEMLINWLTALKDWYQKIMDERAARNKRLRVVWNSD